MKAKLSERGSWLCLCGCKRVNTTKVVWFHMKIFTYIKLLLGLRSRYLKIILTFSISPYHLIQVATILFIGLYGSGCFNSVFVVVLCQSCLFVCFFWFWYPNMFFHFWNYFVQKGLNYWSVLPTSIIIILYMYICKIICMYYVTTFSFSSHSLTHTHTHTHTHTYTQ